MPLSTDSETLTKELKMAAKMGRNFILSLTAKPEDGYLALSKKVIPKSEDVTARKKTQKKVFRGTCFKDGPIFVFETDKKVSPALTLKLKLLIKAQTEFKMKQIELRQREGPGVVATPEPGAAREEEEEEVAAAASGKRAAVEEEEEAAQASASTAAEEEEEAVQASASTTAEEEEEAVAASAAGPRATGEVNPFSGEQVATAPPPATGVNPFAPDDTQSETSAETAVDLSAAELEQLAAAVEKGSEAWEKAVKGAERDVKKLEKAVAKLDDPRADAVVDRLEALVKDLPRMDKQLDRFLAAARKKDGKGAAKCKRDLQKAVKACRRYVEEEDLIDVAESNPLSRVKLRDPLSKALKLIEKAIK